jgi:tetratricopeptide (TPR) repeat protein
MGSAYKALGEYAKAIECLERAQKLDPAVWQIHQNLGDCYFNTAKYRKAVDSYRQATDLILKSLTIVGNVEGLAEGTDVLKLARQSLRDESTPAANFAGFGILVFRLGEYGLANELLERALRLEPSNSGFHSCHAVVSVRLGDYAAARRHCLAANLDSPYAGPQFVIETAGALYSGLGKSYSMAGEYDLAMKAFARALEIAGPRAEVYAALGGAYGLKGEIPAAISSYEKALELDPSDNHARQQLVRCYEKALELDPSDDHARQKLAELRKQLK